MKVVPSQTGESAVTRTDFQSGGADKAAFKAALAKASTEGGTAAPGTDVPAGVTLRKGEEIKAVEGHSYVEITSGAREGMFINTSGNVRNGQAFVLARKNGKEYHIYGTGKDRLVVGFHMPGARKPDEASGGTGAGKPPAVDTTKLDLRKGEKVKPVEGHPYVEITSGAREGMYINTSGNDRHGEAFVLVHKHGVEYHIYGSGDDRQVIALKPRDDDDK